MNNRHMRVIWATVRTSPMPVFYKFRRTSGAGTTRLYRVSEIPTHHHLISYYNCKNINVAFPFAALSASPVTTQSPRAWTPTCTGNTSWACTSPTTWRPLRRRTTKPSSVSSPNTSNSESTPTVWVPGHAYLCPNQIAAKSRVLSLRRNWTKAKDDFRQFFGTLFGVVFADCRYNLTLFFIS